MKILKEIFKRPVTIIFTIVIAIFLGIFSTTNMAINLLPDISFPYLSIKTVYVGADAETVEKNVTRPIEDALKSISDINNLSTYSVDNASIVILEFQYGVKLDEKEKEINSRLNNVSLPSDIESPSISSIDLNGTSIVSISLSGENFSDVVVSSNSLSEKLLAINGVGSIELTGKPINKIGITPINGLELLAPILVTKLTSDSMLDIPLGEIKDENGKITINNSSSAKTVEEIKNLMLNVDLDTKYVELIKEVQNTIVKIEELNLEDLESMKSDALDMKDFINELENKSNDELSDLISKLNTIKGFVELIENNTASGLRLMWSQVLKNLFEDENFKNLTDDELLEMSDKYNINYDVLKWLRDNSDVNSETGKTYAEEKWNMIVAFREENKGDIEDILYASLFYDIELIPSDINDPDYKNADEIADAVKVSRVINTIALNNISTKRDNNDEITDSDYALLFTTPSMDYKLPINSYTIKIIRDSHFEANYRIFYDYKKEHVHLEDSVQVGDSIPSSDFMMLYNSFSFDEEISLKPTLPLLEFIRNLKLNDSSIRFKLSEVSDVNYLSTFETRAYYNGKEAIQIDIYGNSNANTTSIANSCKKIVEEFNSSNVEVIMLNNQSDFINESLSNALVSLIIGMVLAVLVIYLFLRRVKSSIIIAISMPLSVLLTLVCLYLMGITLNMVSVGGIAVGIGMLVDNSIVVLESITSERSKGLEVLEASVSGVKLVIKSLIGSTITSICVFFPILFIKGLTKEIFADLSWAVIFSLSWSLIVAVTVIPTLFVLLYKNEQTESIDKNLGKLFVKLKDFYGKALRKALEHKWMVIIASLVIFLASIGLVFTCPIEFLPSIDQKKIEITIDYPDSNNSEKSQERTLEAYNLIKDNINDINYQAMSVGYSGLIYTSLKGTILLELKDTAKNTLEVTEDIRELFNSKGFNEKYQVKALDGVVASLVGSISGVTVTILGDDVDTLKEIRDKIETKALEYPGIKNVSDNMIASKRSYTLEFKRDKLAEFDIDYDVLVKTLRIGLAGYTVSHIEDMDNEINVDVSFNDTAIGDYYNSLGDFIVSFNDNSPVYLKDVCDIKALNGRNVIRKSSLKNELSISIETYGIDTSTATNALKNITSDVLKDYDGYTYSFGGVSKYLTDAFSGLVVALIISFVLLFGIMACLFESLRKPCVIIFSFPFAFSGGFLFLAISRVSLNVVSFIGLIMLMGVIVNDAIVLNERIEDYIGYGYNKSSAVVEGCKERLRAVLMTTLTTVLALIPMALGLGKGGALMQPLGIVAIGGMTIGTLVTLVLIPSVYSVVYKISFKKEEKNEETI